MTDYDIIVIGAGHAGIEAALACSRLGCKTLVATFKADTIGLMSCNPAIGGVGKGQLVKEIDALGGEMARAADCCGIQFRVLNASKGAAVHSSRAQIDKYLYNDYMRRVLAGQKNLSIKEAEIIRLIVEGRVVKGVITSTNEEIFSTCVIICPGTFMDGIIHVGLEHYSGGRIYEQASLGLPQDLRSMGFNILHFKTGTCARLDKSSIDFEQLIVQNGDPAPKPFSFSTKEIAQKQLPCHITYTNTRTHEVIMNNLDKSPLYSGVIRSTGVRYCPSIEDKIVKFSDKERHQVFLEPEGYETNEVYPNGLSTSLPEEVQLKIIHSIAGLEKAKVIRFGYGIEHAVVEPTQLYPTLEAKSLRNLYFAGQINGTTGYEEAAAQGLIAGINASLRVQNREPFILDRASSYIGVLIDDLTTKGTQEPYRMFTSRLEYRLLIREDNADLRLRKSGFEIGLVSEKEYLDSREKQKAIEKGIEFLRTNRLKPSRELNDQLSGLKSSQIKRPVTLEEILKRPGISIDDLRGLSRAGWEIAECALKQVEIEVKYSGFIQRQLKEVEKFKNLEKIKIPDSLDYCLVQGLSREIKEKLNKFKPINLGQAARISGVTPAAIAILMVYIRKTSAK